MLDRINAQPFDGTRELESDADVPLTQIALRRLRNDIICGKLKPGARLRVGRLRDLYGIGASPLREALSRLVPSGFVVSHNRRGFTVAPISLREFRELTDVRKLLEREAARLSLADGNDAWESHVVAALHRVTKLRAKSAGKIVARHEGMGGHQRSFPGSPGLRMFIGLASELQARGVFLRQAIFTGLPVRCRRYAISKRTSARWPMRQSARDTAKLQGLIENQLERTLPQDRGERKTAKLEPLCRTLSVNNCNFYYEAAGAGRAADIHPRRDAWHGAVRRPAAAFLGPDTRCLTYDRRGHGKSERSALRLFPLESDPRSQMPARLHSVSTAS